MWRSQVDPAAAPLISVVNAWDGKTACPSTIPDALIQLCERGVTMFNKLCSSALWQVQGQRVSSRDLSATVERIPPTWFYPATFTGLGCSASARCAAMPHSQVWGVAHQRAALLCDGHPTSTPPLSRTSCPVAISYGRCDGDPQLARCR